MGHQTPVHEAFVRLLLTKPRVTARNAAMALGEGVVGLAVCRWLGPQFLALPIFGFAALKVMKGAGLTAGCLVDTAKRWRKAGGAGASGASRQALAEQPHVVRPSKPLDVRGGGEHRAMYRNLEEARRAFDRYVALDPQLEKLWRMCRGATHPRRVYVDDEDSPEDPSEGWCSEVYFHREVKPQMAALVGWNRRADPALLRTSDAYDAVYMMLFHFALRRTCVCCVELDQDDPGAPSFA